MLNIEDFFDHPADLIDGSELGPFVIVVLRRFFSLSPKDRQRVEIASFVTPEDESEGLLSARAEELILEMIFDEEDTPINRAMIPLVTWVLRRTAELAGSQRRWLSRTLHLADNLSVEHFDSEEEGERPSDESDLDTTESLSESMERYLDFANWIGRGLKPVPQDTLDVHSLLEEGVHTLYFHQPRKRNRLEQQYGREKLDEYRRDFCSRIKRAAGMKFFWVARLARRMKMPVARLRRWLNPDLALGCKGRQEIAAALGVTVETIDAGPNDNLSTWQEYYRTHCDEVDANCADVQCELQWQVLRWEYYRSRVATALAEDPEKGEEVEAVIGLSRDVFMPGRPPYRLSFPEALQTASILGYEIEMLWKFSEA